MNKNIDSLFTYSIFYKFLYRFGNIPGTIILSFFLYSFASFLNYSLYYLFPFGVTALLIYFVNKQYLTLYKILPYKISLDADSIICSNFLFSKKKVIIRFEDIEKLEGGIFNGKLNGLIKVWDSKSKICIGFYYKVNNSKLLVKTILLNIKETVYIEAMQNARIDLKNLRSASHNINKPLS